jgi:hypothetical protein
MPALPNISGALKLLLQYTLPGVPLILNRLFFQGTGSTTNTAMNNWCSTAATAWNTYMPGYCIPDLTLVAITAEDLTSATSPIGAWAGSHPGTSAGLQGFPSPAFIIKNLDAFRSRGGHSRTYLPGISTNNLTSNGANTWSTTAGTNITTAWNNFLLGITGSNGPAGYSGVQQVVPNYYKGFTAVENPLTGRYRNVPKVNPTPTTQVIVNHTYNDVVGSQRRRNKQSA